MMQLHKVNGSTAVVLRRKLAVHGTSVTWFQLLKHLIGPSVSDQNLRRDSAAEKNCNKEGKNQLNLQLHSKSVCLFHWGKN